MAGGGDVSRSVSPGNGVPPGGPSGRPQGTPGSLSGPGLQIALCDPVEGVVSLAGAESFLREVARRLSDLSLPLARGANEKNWGSGSRQGAQWEGGRFGALVCGRRAGYGCVSGALGDRGPVGDTAGGIGPSSLPDLWPWSAWHTALSASGSVLPAWAQCLSSVPAPSSWLGRVTEGPRPGRGAADLGRVGEPCCRQVWGFSQDLFLIGGTCRGLYTNMICLIVAVGARNNFN